MIGKMKVEDELENKYKGLGKKVKEEDIEKLWRLETPLK